MTALALAIVPAALGCGGSVEPTSGGGPLPSEGKLETPSAAPPAGDIATDTSAADGKGCSIEAKHYDQSCKVDSDCVVTVIGGDTCKPCGEPEDFTCPAALVNASASKSYSEALKTALGTKAGISFSDTVCGYVVSCPEYGKPECSAGKCAFASAFWTRVSVSSTT